MTESADRWRIKEFAAAVGVPETTLRAWERRYALLEPERTSGGFRLYTRADERRIRAMQAHLARGIAAAQAAELAIAESTAEAGAPAATDATDALIAALVAATEAFDATRFDALLDAALARGTIAGVRDVVLPALVDIGRRWEVGEITVGQEHFASQLVQRRLLALAAGWEVGRGPLALLACPPGERHTLGLICFGLILADGGWRIAYLGEDTPIGEIAAASASLRPDAVVLCALDAGHLEPHAETIAGLGARHHTILAGAGASRELAAQLYVDYAAGGPVETAEALVAHPPRPG